jgi:hypothetical protein
MARPRPSVPVLVLATVVLVAGVLIAVAVIKEHGTPTGSSSDAAMNQKIVDGLQLYPGARQTRKFVRESYGGYGGGLLPGQSDTTHSTTIIYSLPVKTRPKQVIDFYAQELKGWERQQGDVFAPCETAGLPGPCSASFTKGAAVVSISFTEGPIPFTRPRVARVRKVRSFSLVVDARGAPRFSSSSD